MIYQVKSVEEAWSRLLKAYINQDGPIPVSFDLDESVNAAEIPINIKGCTRCHRQINERVGDEVYVNYCSVCGEKLITVYTVELIIQGMTVVWRKP